MICSNFIQFLFYTHDIDQHELISVTLPHSGDEYTDEELINRVRESLMNEGRDIQKYQVRIGDNEVPNSITIWRHGYEYSAFATL